MSKATILISLSLIAVVYGQQPVRVNLGGNQQNNGQFAAVQRQNQQRPAQSNVLVNGQNNAQASRNFNQRPQGLNNQGRLPVQQLQQQLSAQPSLVNIGGCSRGVSLRNSDGSTLVCGFGPRDFECPPKFSCTFDNGLKALVCCPAENNTRPNPEKEDDQPNPCPDHEPIRDEFGNRLKCDFAGTPSNTCPAGTLCVVGACCPVSVAGLISVKPGKCPLPLPVSPGQNCQNDCTFDADCPGPAKCCFVGCGARCVASVTQQQQNLAPESNAQFPNGPLSGNQASLAQFNLQQQGAQFPRGSQQGNQFFNQQSQQFQFPNNGPPGTNRASPGAFQQTPPQQQQFRPQQGFPQQNGNGNNNRNRQFDQALEE